MEITKNIKKKKHGVNYNKWGVIFILPFFVTYIIWSLIPLLLTFYYSFFEYYEDGLDVIGPKFVGLKNFANLFSSPTGGAPDLLVYAGNTLILWIIGFLPQIIVSLLLALLFTSTRLKLKGQRFFKTVIYMPNLIMASAFAMLFFALFAAKGPIDGLLVNLGIYDSLDTSIRFFEHTWDVRRIIASMNFLMWFGNTTILLMAGVMGIDRNLFEAAEMDGASSIQVFFKVTMPLLMPIFVYVFITSMIGGIQMFDVPQILTNGSGFPNNSSKTLIMFLNSHLFSKNYGMAGALSVVLFVVTGILSFIVFKILMKPYSEEKKIVKGVKK